MKTVIVGVANRGDVIGESWIAVLRRALEFGMDLAPALLIAPDAHWVDLDGPLLPACDREHGLAYQGSRPRRPCGDSDGGHS